MTQQVKSERADWVRWLEGDGLGKFYDAFARNARGAESQCVHCCHSIFLDIVEGGGVPDWKTRDGDYGCEGQGSDGSHLPIGGATR